MIIYRAIKRNLLTQKFGQNLLPIYKELKMLGHNGVDWSLANGDKVYWDCSIKGTVLETRIDSSGGLGVRIGTHDKDGYFKHRFWHLKEFKCKMGDILETGDLIGLGDNTGHSTGSHLHRDLKKADENYKTIDWDNGYKGAIDPTPYFRNVFVKDQMRYLNKQVSILKAIVEIWNKLIHLTQRS